MKRLPDIRRILVVLIRGGMGDVLVATPVLDALKLTYPEAAIDMMVRPGARDMVAGHPSVDDILVVADGDLDASGPFRRWLAEIRGRHYDLGVVLWSRFSEAWLLYRAGIPHRVGQDSRLTYSWTYTHKVRVRSEHGDEQSHQVDILLDYARAVGACEPPPRPRLWVDDASRQAAAEVLAARGIHGSYLVLHVGRGTPLTPERMPPDPFSRIGDALGNHFGMPVVLTGGEAERAVVAAVARGMTVSPVDLAGVLTVPRLAAVLAGAAVAVMNDAGPMHMAAAVGTPTVGIFAMEKDLPQRWGPSGEGNVVVRPTTFRCRPECLKETCPRMDCYADITPQMVVEAASRAMARHGRERGPQLQAPSADS